MADMSTPKEFLTETLSAVDALDEAKSEQGALNKELKKLKSSYETLLNKSEKEKTDAVSRRRADLKAGYDKQLKSATSAVSSAESKRQKELSRLMKEKKEQETTSLKGETLDLKASLKAYVKEHELPSYLAGRTYYTLFCPGTLGYIALTAVFIILLFFSVGMTFARMKSGGNAAAYALLLFLVIVLFAAYLIFWAQTRVKYRDEIKDCLGIMNNIRLNETKVRDIEKAIEKAGDDKSYDLASFDEELSAKQSAHDEISAQSKAALDKFDEETAPALKAEIDQKYADELKALNSSIEEDEAKLKDVGARVDDIEKTITSKYVSYVGAENLTHDKLSRMIELMESGSASTITEAIEGLKKK